MVVFEDLNGDGYVTSEEDPEKGEVLERFMYYAFGMKWDGIWCPAEPLDPKEEHRYQYNGKDDQLVPMDIGNRVTQVTR